MTRLLPDNEFQGFYEPHQKDLYEQVDDLIECWSFDPEQMLEDLPHEAVVHLLWLSVQNKPCEGKVRDYAYDVVTRKPSDA